MGKRAAAVRPQPGQMKADVPSGPSPGWAPARFGDVVENDSSRVWLPRGWGAQPPVASHIHYSLATVGIAQSRSPDLSRLRRNAIGRGAASSTRSEDRAPQPAGMSAAHEPLDFTSSQTIEYAQGEMGRERMSYEDGKIPRSQHEQGSQPVQTASKPRSAPGKRTRTMNLAPQPAGVRPPVQQQLDPATQAARRAQAELTQHWIDTAVRPDLYPSPEQRKGPSSASDQASPMHVVQRTTDPGARYERGNRPDPSTSTGRNYEIVSNASRILPAGSRVTYVIRRIEATRHNTDGRVTTGWEVINDPRAVARDPDLSDTLTGPPDKLQWTLTAVAPGTHTIRAWVEGEGASGIREELSFQQVVIDPDREYAKIAANVRPAPLATMDDFIALVQRVEDAYSGMAWQDVTSMLRKEYYPGRGGRYGGVTAAFTWDDLIDEQQSLTPLQSPPVAAADIAALRSSQAVSHNGSSIDIGHILTGVDAMSFPSTAGIFRVHGMSGPAAATWSGDVGSALVRYANQAALSDDSDAARESFYSRYASMSDLLGDVDSINLADLPALPASAPLSARLRAYYVTNPAAGVKRRYHNFCRSSGFQVQDGRLSDSAKQYIRAQILAFARGFNVRGSIADGFILGGGAYGGGNPYAIEATSAYAIEQHVDWFANRFIRDIETGLASE